MTTRVQSTLDPSLLYLQGLISPHLRTQKQVYLSSPTTFIARLCFFPPSSHSFTAWAKGEAPFSWVGMKQSGKSNKARCRSDCAAFFTCSSAYDVSSFYSYFVHVFVAMSPLQYSSRNNLLPGRNPSQPHSGCDIRNSSCNQGQGECREHEGI